MPEDDKMKDVNSRIRNQQKRCRAAEQVKERFLEDPDEGIQTAVANLVTRERLALTALEDEKRELLHSNANRYVDYIFNEKLETL